ncbi:hypothetical protein M5689_023814 [Euphorbia peplus]|nr:hypothetical protein M5689_023814 [Euphorbia peplus]
MRCQINLRLEHACLGYRDNAPRRITRVRTQKIGDWAAGDRGSSQGSDYWDTEASALFIGDGEETCSDSRNSAVAAKDMVRLVWKVVTCCSDRETISTECVTRVAGLFT